MLAHRETRGSGKPGPRSNAIFQRAQAIFPDGTSRATITRDPIPRYMKRGEGAHVIDVDNNRYLDLNGNFTTLIHGHAFAPVMKTVARQLENGTCFANPTEAEVQLALLLCSRVPRLDRIRFVNSGTEAIMFALKAARAFTGRPGIAKIEGAYHGAYDWVEVAQVSEPHNWGDSAEPRPTPFYKGVPEGVLSDVVPMPFNDAEAATRLIESNARKLGAVLLDPMPSRAGLVAPDQGFIRAIQETARHHGILIISDEVLNFRQGYEGASARYGIDPDLLTLGKIIGGGFPIGAVGGREDIMEVFSGLKGRPLVPQGGTFSANPVSMVAGLAAMSALDRKAFADLEAMGDSLRMRLVQEIERAKVPFSVTGAASLFLIHPKAAAPRSFREAYQTPAQAQIMTEMTRYFMKCGVILPKAAAASLSTPMTGSDLALIGDVFASFLKERAQLIARMDGA